MPGYDPIVMSKLNRLMDAGGYIQKTALSNNGKNEGKESFVAGDMSYVRIGNSIEFADITEVTINNFGESFVILATYLNQSVDENGNVTVVASGVTGFYILTNTNPYNVSAGVYVLSEPDMPLYITSIKAETIVPIDQKYLPGVCLPVVEIADISAITAEEGAELGKHIGIPVVIKVTIDGTLNCCVFNYTYVDAYRTHLYGTTIGTDAVILTSSDGVLWTKG